MLATPQGYDFFDNEINGETFAVQRNTGEVFGAHLQYIIDGSVIYTPEQREYLRKKYDQKAKKEAVYTRTTTLQLSHRSRLGKNPEFNSVNNDGRIILGFGRKGEIGQKELFLYVLR